MGKTHINQLSFFDILEPAPIAAPVASSEPITTDQALATMRGILQQYHASAVAGDGAMQLDAAVRFEDLVTAFKPTRPEHSAADVMDFLFQATAAGEDEPLLFGQAFKRIVDLGPCRALLCFAGFDIVGGCLELRAVDPGPFVSETGYRSCQVMFRGWSRQLVHSLEGRNVVDYMTQLSMADLNRHKKTKELIVVPWKPFAQWMADQKRAEVA